MTRMPLGSTIFSTSSMVVGRTVEAIASRVPSRAGAASAGDNSMTWASVTTLTMVRSLERREGWGTTAEDQDLVAPAAKNMTGHGLAHGADADESHFGHAVTGLRY